MKKKVIVTTIAVVVLGLTGAVVALNHHPSDAAVQATDDAYVRADFTRVAPQVSGLIASVDVDSYEEVKAGSLLFTIDDSDLNNALQQALADVARATAAVGQAEARLKAHDSIISQARAVLSVDDANLVLAKANQTRFTNLAADGSGTAQDKQQADAVLGVQQATRKRDEQALNAALEQKNGLAAELKSAQAQLQAAQAGEAQARLNLSYTRITAPVAGIVAERQARSGSYAHAGQSLMTLVPLDALYVEANYRETQTAHIQSGQKVDIHVDALPGVTLHGTVGRLGPASGVSYSSVAPHNATGNFTKIVQRLPIRIRLDQGQQALSRLRVGMSVHPEIHTH
ncbi:MAG: efflux transporter periplasmic adaptor subunit [Oceanospirillaceae bacterium]|nr:efflux transporter periplasmic adaptor subunit [Oceanospirillaceae bacterium]